MTVFQTLSHEILTQNLCIAAKCVPSLWTDKQDKFEMMWLMSFWMKLMRTKTCLKKTISTSEELWLYGYDIETKAQLLQWISKGSSQMKMWGQTLKWWWQFFCDCVRVVHHKLVASTRQDSEQRITLTQRSIFMRLSISWCLMHHAQITIKQSVFDEIWDKNHSIFCLLTRSCSTIPFSFP